MGSRVLTQPQFSVDSGKASEIMPAKRGLRVRVP